MTHYYKKAIALDDFTIKEYTTGATKDFQLEKAFPIYESYVKHIIETNTKSEAVSVLEILEKQKPEDLRKRLIRKKVP